jgi:hypothetical protein
MPSNSYAIRVEALRRSGVRVDETMDSLEDWLFLLNLLEKGLRFHQLDMTLSEFRSESAADFAYRNDLDQWKANNRRIREYINSTSFPIPGSDLARLREVRQNIPASYGCRFAPAYLGSGTFVLMDFHRPAALPGRKPATAPQPLESESLTWPPESRQSCPSSCAIRVKRKSPN